MLTSVLIFLVVAWINVIKSESNVCELSNKCIANCENSNYTEIQKNYNCNFTIHVMKLGTSKIQVSDLRFFEDYSIGFLHLNNKSLHNIEDVTVHVNKMNVSKLNLNNNNIKKLKTSCFRNEYPFKQLSLNNNLINYIEIKSIPKAKNIHLNNNLIQVISSNMFVDIKIVETLFLDYNCLKTLTDASLTGLTAKTLSLKYNEIENLEANSIPMVQNVYINANRLESLDANIFINISRINVLNLCCNNINNISEGAFKAGNFTSLVLDSNNITRITEKTFSGLSRAVNLSLSKNAIELLEDDSITRVENLNLKFNPLNGIHKAAFRDLKYLKIVEVTYKDTFDISLPKGVTVLNFGAKVKHHGMHNFKIRKTSVYAICGIISIVLVGVVIGIIAKKQCSKRSKVTQYISVHLRKETRKAELPEAPDVPVNEYEEFYSDH